MKMETLGHSAALLVIAGGLLLGGCSSSKRATSTDKPGEDSQSVATNSSGLSVDRLSSLTNYRAQMQSGTGKSQMTIRTDVHSPDNWAVLTGIETRHIGGERYLDLGKYWVEQKDQPGEYARINLPSVAKGFYSMTHVSHASVKEGDPCQQAGLSGHTWTISAAGGGLLNERFEACVADKSGALLRLKVSTQGQATGGREIREFYQILSVGDVPAYKVPAPVHKG